MLNQMKKLKNHIEHILAIYPETRDDDRLLIMKFFELNTNIKNTVGPAAWAAFETVFLVGPSFESIRRARQKIQEKGKYIGHRQDERSALADEMRRSLRSDNDESQNRLYLFNGKEGPDDAIAPKKRIS